MNLILHQFKTDVRHFRWLLLLLWLSFAAVPALLGFNLVSGDGASIVDALLTVWQVGAGIFLVAQLVQADPLVGTSAAWLTRPVRRQHLFWAKSAFLLLCLLLPRLAMQSATWLLRDYSAHQVFCAALESLLFSGVVVAVTAVTAALTRDLSRFFLGIGIVTGGMFAWVVVVEMLDHIGLVDPYKSDWQNRVSHGWSAASAALLFLIAAALLAWILQARIGRWRAAAGWFALGLLALPVIGKSWPVNFLKPRLTQSVPLSVNLWQTNLPATEQSQRLYAELILTGVPTQHLAVAQILDASILFQGDRELTLIPRSPYSAYGGRIRPADSGQSLEYFRMLRDFFPAQTLWFDSGYRNGVSTAFYNESEMKRFTNHPTVGKLSGYVELDLYAVTKVAEAPVQPGRFTIQPGRSVTIQQVKFLGDTILVVVDESTPKLMLDREAVNAASSRSGTAGYCTYVLYHPGSGEAYLVVQRITGGMSSAVSSSEVHCQLQLRFPYPALRERFAGVTAAEWLRGARLVVFAPVYAGTAKLDFRKDDYVWPLDYGVAEKKSLADREAIEQAVLPSHPTAAQLDAYLDTLCQNVPDNTGGDLHEVIKTKFAAVGTNGLPALIRRLPLDARLEQWFVIPAIRQLATREHLLVLLAALQRDYNVVDVFTAKHWEADARVVLVSQLSDHTRPLPAEALRIVAGAKNAQTYEDLRWHFLHLKHGQQEVVAALEQCPGFDVAGLIREAWARSQMGLTDGYGLAIAAAKQGLPDALATAVVALENPGYEWRKPSELAQLTSLTGYTGPATNALAWLGENLASFRFDPAQQRYVLEPKH